MSRSRQRRSLRRKRRIEHRLVPRQWAHQGEPMFRATNVHYDVADRTRALGCGGIGAIHLMCRRTGLVEAIDRDVHLLKLHLPYSESDHVCNIAFNALCGGTCLEDLELRRNDESYLDALGAQRIPDPTTAGDFFRRFGRGDLIGLMDACNKARLEVWPRWRGHTSSCRSSLPRPSEVRPRRETQRTRTSWSWAAGNSRSSSTSSRW